VGSSLKQTSVLVLLQPEEKADFSTSLRSGRNDRFVYAPVEMTGLFNRND
jgi:hypothetical protein